MGKLNINQVEPKVRSINRRRLYHAFHNLSEKEVAELMGKLLTQSEIEMFSKRIGVAVLLELGHDYATIRQILKVSDATIAKINNLYLYDEKLRDLIRDFVKEELKPPSKYYSLNQVAVDLGFEINKVLRRL